MSATLVGAGPDTGAVWHHGNPVAEQRALTGGVGLVDRGHHGVLRVSGPDRRAFLHSLTTQHFEGLGEGSPTTALVLSPQGHIEHAMTGMDDGEAFWAFTEPGAAAGLVEFLTRMRFMMRVEVDDLSAAWRLLWVGDAVAMTQTGAVDASGGGVLSWASAIPGGRDVLWPRDHELPDHTPAGLWALEALRIAAGWPRLGLDTDHRTIPNELGLWGTHLDKGCYRGQETVARVHTLGRPPRRLARVLLDGSVDALPQVGSQVLSGGRPAGVMGSSARHHEEGPIGLALLKRGLDTSAEIQVSSADGTVIAASQEALVDPEVGLHVRPHLRG